MKSFSIGIRKNTKEAIVLDCTFASINWEINDDAHNYLQKQHTDETAVAANNVCAAKSDKRKSKFTVCLNLLINVSNKAHLCAIRPRCCC